MTATTTRDDKLAYWRTRYRNSKAQWQTEHAPDPIDQMSAVDAAYIAGLADGEGCLTITWNSRVGVIGVHVPTIAVMMTSHDVLGWLAERLGTKVCRHDFHRADNPNHCPYWRVKIGGMRAIKLCQHMRPYLRVKYLQADVFIEFGQTYRPGWDHRLPDDTVASREALKARIHDLNSRGRRRRERAAISSRQDL